MSYSVGQVAGFAGVTVRTLHHYDAIGLLVPSARSRAGHRRYSDADLDRLQQILFYRELGFPLEEVAALLDDPAADPRAHLRRQHDLLTARIERLQKMAAAVEQAMEARTMGINLTPEEKFEVFGDFDPDQYQEEVQERWGDTDAYRQSQQKTASYTKEDWQRIQRESDELTRRFVALMDAGERRTPRRRWTSPRTTARASPATTTTAATRCTPASGRCTSTTSASRATSTRRRRVWPRTCGTRSSPTPYGTPPEWSWPGRSGPRPAVIPHGAGSRLSPGRGTVHPGYPRGTWASTAAFIIWAASPALDPSCRSHIPVTTLALGPEWLSPDYLIETFSLPGILLIVFAESGLFAFLPGDSLLFTAGLFVAEGNYISQPLWLVCTLIVLAAVIGDQVGYMIGKFFGPRLFSKAQLKLFKQENLEKAHEFMEKYGPKAIVLARFVPIVRTFAPIVV